MRGALTSLRAQAIGALGLSLFLCGCKDDRPPVYILPDDPVPNPDVPHERLPEQSDAFTETACKQKAATLVTQCGYVTVPEGPGSDREIKIAVARVFSRSRNPKPEPIAYLDGGPGIASIVELESITPLISAMAPDRDIIFIDQRGVGQTVPELGCREDGEIEDALPACYERLSKKADLNHYSTLRSAEDIDRVRRAFGYEQWNLLGISYGTRLGLIVMRDYPQSVRSILLDSVAPPQTDFLAQIGLNGSRAIDRAFAACAADADCAEAYPGVATEFLDLVARLNEEPEKIGNVTLSGADVVKIIFMLLYSSTGVEVVPFLVHDLYEGDFSVFEKLLDTPSLSGGGLSFGMHLSLRCAEDVPFTSREALEMNDAEVPEELRAGLTGAYYLDYCENWPVAPTPESEVQPVVSDVPALVMAGYFDPITPPAFAEEAFASLTNAQYFMIATESHGASFGKCGAELAKEFFNAPESPITGACLSDLPPLEFASSGASEEQPAAGSGARRLRFRTESPTKEELDRLREAVKIRLR